LQRADTAGKGAPAHDLLPETRLAGGRASIPRATFRDRPSLMPSANSRRYGVPSVRKDDSAGALRAGVSVPAWSVRGAGPGRSMRPVRSPESCLIALMRGFAGGRLWGGRGVLEGPEGLGGWEMGRAAAAMSSAAPSPPARASGG
jgi:hypothetical protein